MPTARAVVLMYHRIDRPRMDRHGLCVSPEAFYAQMEFLHSDGYSVIPLAQLSQALRNRTVPERSVVLTFDDGYLDSLTAAAPILLEFGLPATFYVVSRAVNPGYEFWWDTLETLFMEAKELPDSIELTLPDGVMKCPTSTAAERESAHDRLSELFYSLSASSRDAIVAALCKWSRSDGRHLSVPPTMGIEQVRILSRLPGMSIGAHTVNHVYLPWQPDEAKRSEIVESKAALEHALDCRITSFSYPYGESDEIVARMVEEAGFLDATTRADTAVSNESHCFFLPRHNVSTTEELSSHLRSIFERPS